MKKQGNNMSPKEHNDSLTTDPKEKGMPEKEFKRLILRK
jgi:hypothetical protein